MYKGKCGWNEIKELIFSVFCLCLSDMVYCRYVNIQWKDKKGTVFLENPEGEDLSVTEAGWQSLARRLFRLNATAVSVSKPDNGLVTVQ